jgi:hypothetical protein
MSNFFHFIFLFVLLFFCYLFRPFHILLNFTTYLILLLCFPFHIFLCLFLLPLRVFFVTLSICSLPFKSDLSYACVFIS